MGERELILCLPCESNGESNSASGYCIICVEPLCERCMNCHKTFRATKTHKLVYCSKKSTRSFLDAQFLSSNMYCPNHTDEPVKIKCEVHNTLCCLTCALVNHRNCQTVREIDEIAVGYRNNGQKEKIRLRLEEIKSSIEEIITVNEDYRQDFEKSKEEILKQLEQVKTKILDLFEKIESFIKKRVNTLQNDEDISIGNREETWKLKLNTHISLLKMLDTLVEMGTDSQVYVAIHKINEKLAETETAIAAQGNCITGQRLNLNVKETLKAILETNSIEKLVDIETIQSQYHLPKTSASCKSGIEHDKELSSDTFPGDAGYSANSGDTLQASIGATQHKDSQGVDDGVLKNKQELTLQAQGDDCNLRANIPHNINIDSVDKTLVHFIRKNSRCIEAVNRQLEGCYAKVVWPKRGSTIAVECKITVKTPDYTQLVNDWKSKVEKNLMDFINQFSCEEHPVLDEEWDAVLGEVSHINIDNPDAVILFADKAVNKIRVVGYRHTVESVSKMVKNVIRNVRDEIERKMQTVKQTISN